MPFALTSLASQLAVLVVFVLFSFGLLTAAKMKRRSRRSGKELAHEADAGNNAGLDLLAGLIGFAVTCNILLILPGLIELLHGGDELPILWLHRLCSGLTTTTTLLVAMLGLMALLQTSRSPALKVLRPWSSLVTSSFGADAIGPISDSAVRVLAFVPAVYLLSAPYIGFQYDTGLYHLPSLLHFQAFGPEVGLANFHFSFGFFNLQQFAQVSLQNLSPSRFVLSPSLNLIFLEAFILTIASDLCTQKLAVIQVSRQKTIRALLFLATGLGFGIPSLGSLVSFDADFAVSMTTLMLVYIIYFADQDEQRDQALALSLFLPLLKLSGALGLALILLLEGLRRLPILQNIRRQSAFTSLCLRAQGLVKKRIVTGVTVFGYLGMMATNVITSGYVLFPISTTGPLGNHAVDQSSTRFIRSALVTNYARFNDNGSLSVKAYPKHLHFADWLPQFLPTSRGQLMTFWIISALGLFLVITAMAIAGRRRQRERRLLVLSICLIPVTLLALLVLPPNPRFFPWIGSLIGFEFAELVLLYPVISLLATACMMSLVGLRLQRSLLKSTGVETYSIKTLSRNQLHGWQSRYEAHEHNKGISVRSPREDKCWSIQPPCTPYLPSAQGKSKITSSQ